MNMYRIINRMNGIPAPVVDRSARKIKNDV